MKWVLAGSKRTRRLYKQWLDAGAHRDGTLLDYRIAPEARVEPKPILEEATGATLKEVFASGHERIAERAAAFVPPETPIPAPSSAQTQRPPLVNDRRRPAPAEPTRGPSLIAWVFIVAILVVALAAFAGSAGRSNYPDGCYTVPDSQGWSIEC